MSEILTLRQVQWVAVPSVNARQQMAGARRVTEGACDRPVQVMSCESCVKADKMVPSSSHRHSGAECMQDLGDERGEGLTKITLSCLTAKLTLLKGGKACGDSAHQGQCGEEVSPEPVVTTQATCPGIKLTQLAQGQ